MEWTLAQYEVARERHADALRQAEHARLSRAVAAPPTHLTSVPAWQLRRLLVRVGMVLVAVGTALQAQAASPELAGRPVIPHRH